MARRYYGIGISLLFYLFPNLNYAFPSASHLQVKADQEVSQFYKQQQTILKQPLNTRIVLIGQQFLKRPYELGALGEGVSGYFDQYPLYRVDAFDCETYVDTVLALAFGHDLNSFKQYLYKIRYHQGRIAFINRNHFMSLDWNPNNQKQGYIRDITAMVLEQASHNKPLIARAFIDKPRWYQSVAQKRIRLADANLQESQRRGLILKQQGETSVPGKASIPYIPFNWLFNKQGQPNQALFDRIPQGAILEIVRPNWDLTPLIGTHLNVSHLGFVLRESNQLYYLQASIITKQISKIPLIDYLREAQHSPTIRGINLQQVLPVNKVDKQTQCH